GTGGSVTINGEFQTSNLNGFRGSSTAAISNTNSPTITLGTTSTIRYNAIAGNQTVNGGTYAGGVAIGGISEKTLDGNMTINNGNNFGIDNAARLNAQAFQISFGAAGSSVNILGRFETANTSGFSGNTSAAINSTNLPSITLGATSTIVYTANASQSITAFSGYGNVIVTGTSVSPKVLAGSSTFQGGATLTIDTASYFSAGSSTISFSGTGGAVNVQGRFLTTNANGFSGGTGTTIVNTNSPTVTLGSNSDIFYNSALAQTITPRTDYNIISFGNTSTKTLSGGNLTCNTLNVVGGTNTIVLEGTSTTTINQSISLGATSVIRLNSTQADFILNGTGNATVRLFAGANSARNITLNRPSDDVTFTATASATLTIASTGTFQLVNATNLLLDANVTVTSTGSFRPLAGYVGGNGFLNIADGDFRTGHPDGVNDNTTTGALRIPVANRSFTTGTTVLYVGSGINPTGNYISEMAAFGCNITIGSATRILSENVTMASGRTFTVNGGLFMFDFFIGGSGGFFVLGGSGGLGVGSAAGIAGTLVGNIRVPIANRTYTSGSQIFYCRNGNQSCGSDLPNASNSNITVSDSTILTLNANPVVGSGRTFTVNGRLNIPNGNQITGSGAFTLSNNATVEFSGGIAVSPSSGQIGVTGLVSLNNPGSRVVFNGTITQVPRFGAFSCQKLVKSNTGTLAIENSVTVADSAEFIGGATDFYNGGTLTLNGPILGNATLTSNDGDGILNIGGTGTISNALTTPSAVRTLTMDRSGQTFVLSRSLQVGNTIGSLNLNNGTVRVNNPDTLTIRNTFSRTNGFINSTAGGGHVRFNDNATLLLPAASFTSNRVFGLILETIGSAQLTGGSLAVDNSLRVNFGNVANLFIVGSDTLTLNGSLSVIQGRLDLSDGTLAIGGTGALTLNPAWFQFERIRRLRLARNGNVVASGASPLLLRDLELNFPSSTLEFQIGSIPRLQFDFISAFPTITKTQGVVDATNGTVQFLEGLTVPENTFKNDVIFGCRFECNNADLTLNGSLTVTNDLLMNPNFAVRRINVGDSLILSGTLTYTQGSVNVGADRTLVNNGVASFPNGFFTSNQVGNLVINRAGGVALNSNLTTLAGDTLYLQNGNLSLLSPLTLTVNGFMQTDSSHSVVSSGNFTLSGGATLATQHPSGVTGAIAVTGTRIFNTTASYIFNRAGNQNLGFPIGLTNCANLTFAGSGFKTLNIGTLTANAGFNINSGIGLNTNGFALTYSGSADLFNAGIHSGAGQIRMSGTTSTNITGGGIFATLEINKSPGNFAVMTTPLTLNILLQTSGQLSLNGQTLTVRHSVTTTIHNDNSSSSFVCGDSTGTVNLLLSPVNTLRSLSVNRPSGFMTLGGNLTIENSLNLINGSLAIGGNTLTLDNAIVTGTGLLRGISVSNLVFTGLNDVGTINFQPGFQNLQSLTLSRTSADTLTLGTPLTASTVNLNGGRLVGGNNLVPTTLNYFGGLISPPPGSAIDVQISPAANGQFLSLPPTITNTLFIQDGFVNIAIENDVITSNLDFGNRTLLNMVEPRTLTVTNNIIPDLTEPVPSRVNGRLRRPVDALGRIWYIGDSTRFRPLRMVATSGTGSATIRYIRNDSLPIPAQVGLSGVAGRAVRYWDIDASGVTADIAFTYDASDFPFTFNESAMQCYHWTGTVWERKTKDSQDLTNDTIRITGVSSFSPFLLTTTEDAPLPVSLTTFTGTSTNEGVKLAWETATEQDNLGFEIRRSHDGITEVIAHYRNTPELRGRGTTLEPTQYAYTDARTEQGKTYRYVLRSFDLDGTIHEYSDKAIDVHTTETLKPTEFALAQNFPNPFNPTTIIQYQLPENSPVKLELYDVTGRKVATLINAWQTAGYYSFSLNGSAYNLSSGMYFYRLNAGNFVQTKKMMLVK
ncbi:MAG: T9SS type A sorting domain-containing protein, partial [Chloroherpetonaceae bacterium]